MLAYSVEMVAGGTRPAYAHEEDAAGVVGRRADARTHRSFSAAEPDAVKAVTPLVERVSVS